MEKVLITGGAGFIGGYLAQELSPNYEVTVLDNFSPQIHGADYTKSYLYQQVKDVATIRVGSVLDKDILQDVLKDVDYIFHLAAETGTGQSMYDLSKYSEVNIVGLSNIFETIVKNDYTIKKIVLSSSRSIYGEGTYLCKHHGEVVPESRSVSDMSQGDFEVKCPHCNANVSLLETSENSTPRPISFYAFTKWAQEKMLEQMCNTLNIPYTIFRYQNVYGEGQSLKNPYTGILSIFSKLMLENQPISIFEDGLESRDFVNVKDIAWYTAQSIQNKRSDNEIINLGSGKRTTVLDVANTLKQLYDSTSPIEVTSDFRKGDIKHNIAAMDHATQIFGERSLIQFDEGIRAFARWVQAEGWTQFESKNDYVQSIEELKKTGMFVSGKRK